MIYAAFTIYLLLIIAMGLGIYRQWTAMVRPAIVHWALLPGTIVSEMAYIFGCLITGGEIKRAKLMDSGGGSGKGAAKGGEGASAPATEAAPKLKFIGPAVASLLAIVACGAAIVAVHNYLGKPVIETFAANLAVKPETNLPAVVPMSWAGFWNDLDHHLRLLRRMGETYAALHWTDWHVPLFVYLAACLSIRLAPARKEVRAMLFSAVLVAAAVALAGAISPRFTTLMTDLWPLVTYVWTSLLFLLVLTLLIRGLVGLIKVLAGK